MQKIHEPELEDLTSVPFIVDAAYGAGGGTPQERYQLFSVKYSQFIILTFLTGLLWVMGLWTMGAMLKNDILPPLPRPVGLAKIMTLQWRTD
jgi:hypothetical protein